MSLMLPGTRLSGSVSVPASKSWLHRYLLLAAMGTRETAFAAEEISADVQASLDCLQVLGAEVRYLPGEVRVRPMPRYIPPVPEYYPHRTVSRYTLPVGESGTTLRFMLPFSGLVDTVTAEFEYQTEGRLADRPLEPLMDVLRSGSGYMFRSEGGRLISLGSLHAGVYRVPAGISSQFVSGMLLALPFVSEGESLLLLDGKTVSTEYIRMTEDALKAAHIRFSAIRGGYSIPGGQKAILPPKMIPEGDASAAVPFAVMGAFSEKGITVRGVRPDSAQPDSRIFRLLEKAGAEVLQAQDGYTVRKGKACRGQLRKLVLDAAEMPDAAPCGAVLAMGGLCRLMILHPERLRVKESDRAEGIRKLAEAVGARCVCSEDVLTVEAGSTDVQAAPAFADVQSDHRLAMAAAAAAVCCGKSLRIEKEDCVGKSFPGFWKEYFSLESENGNVRLER